MGRAGVQNEHSTDDKPDERLCARVLAFTLKVRHGGSSYLGWSVCSEGPSSRVAQYAEYNPSFDYSYNDYLDTPAGGTPL